MNHCSVMSQFQVQNVKVGQLFYRLNRETGQRQTIEFAIVAQARVSGVDANLAPKQYTKYFIVSLSTGNNPDTREAWDSLDKVLQQLQDERWQPFYGEMRIHTPSPGKD